MGALDGRVGLVTGAGWLRGIGRATAVALADRAIRRNENVKGGPSQ